MAVELLNTVEAAEFLDVHPKSLNKMHTTYNFAPKKKGRLNFYTKGTLNKVLKAMKSN